MACFGRRPRPPGRAEPWLTPLVGFTTGIVNGMTGSYILPSTSYLQSLGLGRDEFIQAMGIFFLAASSSLGIALAGHSVMTLGQTAISAAALAPTLVGYYVGQAGRRRLPEQQFRKVFFIGLLLLGAYTVLTRLVF